MAENASKQAPRGFLIEFIELYRSFTCLWLVKSKEYSDRNKKGLAYIELVKKFKEFFKNSFLTRLQNHPSFNQINYFEKNIWSRRESNPRPSDRDSGALPPRPIPSADRNTVVKKINALRTVYKKELLKVESSEKSGAGADDIYKTSL
ncbi:uncharacterized protein [Leptinotarsa decemlineata]|uniref:uncharacterized protein n=1 Tax=Leptinotarsa decemlineata TaxID=7539 RepID=UPI003D30CA00